MFYYYSQSALCGDYFIRYPDLGLTGILYDAYYFIYLLAAFLLFLSAASKRRNIHEKRLFYLGALGIAIFNISTFVFLLLLPQYYPEFPSVYCEFALLLAIEFLLVVRYKEKHRLRFR